MSRSVCILYGLNEGPAMGRDFAMSCERMGFTLVHDPATADVIFAHSGGCLLIPARHQARLVMLAGLPYWPGRSWLTCTAVKAQQEFRLYHRQHRLKQWTCKWAYHMRYALNLKAGLRMAVNLGIDKPWNGSRYQAIVRNRHDAYCTPYILDLPFNGPRAFISLPGEHDDCWDNPVPYIRLVQSLIEQEANHG